MNTSQLSDDIGYASYDSNDFGAPWWLERATDKAHQRAYASIVEYAHRFVAASLNHEPTHIIDYACGPGMLLRALLREYPQAHCYGLDESTSCLDAAQQVITRARLKDNKNRLSLIRTALPNFDLQLPPADIAFFTFPDFRARNERLIPNIWGTRFPDDWAASKQVRRHIVALGEMDDVWSSAALFYKRLAGLNMHKLVKPGGLIIRVDYATCTRAACAQSWLDEMAWAECSMPYTHKGKQLACTELIASRYSPSGVMEDVYKQTGDPEDKVGGFLVSILRAL